MPWWRRCRTGAPRGGGLGRGEHGGLPAHRGRKAGHITQPLRQSEGGVLTGCPMDARLLFSLDGELLGEAPVEEGKDEDADEWSENVGFIHAL